MMTWTDSVFPITARFTYRLDGAVWEFMTAAVLILAVVLLRRLLIGRVSARVRYALWAVVLVQLLLPVTVGESAFSARSLLERWDAFQALELAPADIRELENGDVEIYDEQGGYGVIVTIKQRVPAEHVPQATERSTVFSDRGLGLSLRQLRGMTQLRRGMMTVHLVGAGTVAAFLLAAELAFRLRLRRRRQAVGNYQGRPVYVAEGLTSPCLVGLFCPAIYLTPEVLADETARRHVLAHEYTHFRHGDHIWAVLRGLCLIRHWYDPLVWVAAFLSRRDGELACDEGAVAALGEAQRADYGRTLVALVTRRTRPDDMLRCATTMTGGTSAVKERVAALVERQRTSAVAAVAAGLVLACVVCFVFAGGASAEPGDFQTHDWPVQLPWTEAD